MSERGGAPMEPASVPCGITSALAVKEFTRSATTCSHSLLIYYCNYCFAINRLLMILSSASCTSFILPREIPVKLIPFLKDTFPDIPEAIVFGDAPSADRWQATLNAASTRGFRLMEIERRDLRNGARLSTVPRRAWHLGDL